jgi:cytochrome bd-type quinol oxidase subunit 1
LDRSTSINDQHPTVVRFEYTVDGRHYEQSSSGLDDRLLALAPGQALPIEISRWNPELARVSGTTRAVVGYGGLFVLLFPLIGLTLLGLTVRARRRAIRAFVHGRPVTAAVTFTGHDRSVEMNGRNPFKVAWQFLADDGRLYTGALSAMDPTTLEMLANAVEIVVLYDPANPRANTAFIA